MVAGSTFALQARTRGVTLRNGTVAGCTALWQVASFTRQPLSFGRTVRVADARRGEELIHRAATTDASEFSIPLVGPTPTHGHGPARQRFTFSGRVPGERTQDLGRVRR